MRDRPHLLTLVVLLIATIVLAGTVRLRHSNSTYSPQTEASWKELEQDLKRTEGAWNNWRIKQ